MGAVWGSRRGRRARSESGRAAEPVPAVSIGKLEAVMEITKNNRFLNPYHIIVNHKDLVYVSRLLVRGFFLEILKIHMLVWIFLWIFSCFESYFINVLIKVIINFKFDNCCFIKDYFQKNNCIIVWCLVHPSKKHATATRHSTADKIYRFSLKLSL